MALARRIIYNGNASNSVDYIPLISGAQRFAYVNGIRIPHWVSNTQPASAMTSASAPSPYAVTASSMYTSSYAPYLAFNKSYSNANGWVAGSTDQTSPWIMLDMGAGNVLKNISVRIYNRTRSSLVNGPKAGVVQGSDNGSSFTQIGSFSGWSGTGSGALGGTVVCNNYNATYRYVRIVFSDWVGRGNSSDKYLAVGEIYIDGKRGT